MKLGASTKSFGGKTVRETAELFAACGLSCAELCFYQSDLSGWKYNLCGYSELACEQEVISAVKTFGEYGIEVSAIGIYNCMWGGTSSEIFDSYRLFTEYCRLASAAEVKILATHGGTASRLPRSRSFDAKLQERMNEGFLYALTEAKKRGLTVAVECGDGDALKNYDDYVSLGKYAEKAIGSADMLKYICCPASENAGLPTSEIALCHIKDRKRGGLYFERFGSGDTDFAPLLEKVGKISDMPMILEYVNSENLAETADSFRAFTGQYS